MDLIGTITGIVIALSIVAATIIIFLTHGIIAMMIDLIARHKLKKQREQDRIINILKGTL